MDEEGSDFGGFVVRVEEGVFAGGVLVASVEGAALAPSAAGCDLVFDFYCEIGSVGDELGVDSVDAGQGAFDLGGGIILRLAGRGRWLR